MRIDNLNELPEWEDDEFRDEEDEAGEGWKPDANKGFMQKPCINNGMKL